MAKLKVQLALFILIFNINIAWGQTKKLSLELKSALYDMEKKEIKVDFLFRNNSSDTLQLYIYDKYCDITYDYENTNLTLMNYNIFNPTGSHSLIIDSDPSKYDMITKGLTKKEINYINKKYRNQGSEKVVNSLYNYLFEKSKIILYPFEEKLYQKYTIDASNINEIVESEKGYTIKLIYKPDGKKIENILNKKTINKLHKKHIRIFDGIIESNLILIKNMEKFPKKIDLENK